MSQVVVVRHIDVIGRCAALLKDPSYHWILGFESPEQKVSGSVESFGKEPQKFWLNVEIPGAGKYLRAPDGRRMGHFNPQPGYRSGKDWGSDARRGRRRLTDDRQQHLTDVRDLSSVVNDEAGLIHARTVGRTRFLGREFLQLDIDSDREPPSFLDPASVLRAGLSEWEFLIAPATPICLSGLIREKLAASRYRDIWRYCAGAVRRRTARRR